MGTTANPMDAGLLQALQQDFESLDAKQAPAWLVARRTEAMRRFLERGLPAVRDEAWLYSDPRTLNETRRRAQAPVRPVQVPALAARIANAAPGPQVVVVNGRIDAEASTLAAPWLSTFEEALTKHGETLQHHLHALAKTRGSSLVDLNTAFLEEAVFVHLPEHAAVEHPLHVVHVAAPDSAETPSAVHPRLFVLADEGAKAQIVETYVHRDGGPDFVNPVTEILLGANSTVHHLRLQMEGEGVRHTGSTAVLLDRDATYDATAISFGGALARHEIHTRTVSGGAEARLNGLYLVHAKDHADTHIIVDHEEPYGSSHQLYKGILSDKSRGAFTGRVVVHEDAQKADATQANHNLLLSRDAVAETRPQLEIYADDVQCAHGATVGELDEDAIFYLQSRAVGREAARRLLIRAFAHEVVKRIENEALQNAVHEAVEARLLDTEALA